MPSPPSYVVEEERSFGLLPKKGPPAYRILAAPAHIPCAGDIIARFVEFGKVRNCLPPPRGKVPPQGADETNYEKSSGKR